MEHGEFRIGVEFWCGGRRWRCTDVGSRVIVAIRVDGVDTVQRSDGVTVRKPLSGPEAEAAGWFDGPPYAVAEFVFDEDSLEVCSLEYAPE